MPQNIAAAEHESPQVLREALTVVERTLSLAESVCLAVLCEEPSHGWAVSKLLSTNGEIGRAWSLSRPLVYRAIDSLAASKLILCSRTVAGDGPNRQVYRASAPGRRQNAAWLGTPVEHLRDVRTVLLMKMMFCERSGLPVQTLLRKQHRQFVPIVESFRRTCLSADSDLVDRWRLESSSAVLRFLEQSMTRPK